MISMKDYERMSYRQLQAVAKNTKVPANLKKSYLVKLLIARSKGDEGLVLKIVQEAHCERAHSKGHQSIRSLLSAEETPVFRNNATRQPNTELEKLLKAPVSKLENTQVDYKGRSLRHGNTGNGRHYKCCDTNQVSKVSTTTREIGRKRKPIAPIQTKLEIHNVDSDSDDYDSDGNSITMAEKLKKSFDPQMGSCGDTVYKIPQSDGSSDYLDVDNWTSDSGVINLTDNTVSKNLTGKTDVGMKSDIVTNSTNVVSLDEYNGRFGREQVYRKTQKLTTSETTSFNMQDFHQNPYEARYKKENYIVINQHFQFYGSMMPEQNRNVIQEIHNYDTVSENRLPGFETFENPCDEYIIDNKHAIYNHCSNLNPINGQIGGKRPEPENYGNKALIFPNHHKNYTLNSNNVIENSALVRSNGSNVLYKNIKNQNGKCINSVRENIPEKHSTETITSDTNKQIECFNNASIQTPDVSATNQDPQKKHQNEFLKEFLSLDLRYDINEDISSVIQDYFDSLDIPVNDENVKVLSSEDVPVSSEEEVYTSHLNDTTNNQRELPYVPIDGVPTSMLCFICDWIGKVSEFDLHVRMKHTNDTFVTNDGMLTIAINMGTISKKVKNHQKQCFIVHEGNLYVAHFKFKYPDIIQPILLSIPQNGQTVIDDKSLWSAKFHMQIINYMKEQEMLWSGMIECINTPRRPLDVDVFSNRKHGKFEVSMRSLDLVPNNIPLKEIAEYLEGCIVEIHFFIETMDL